MYPDRNAGHTVAAWTTLGGSTFVHTVALRGGSAVRDSIMPAGAIVTTELNAVWLIDRARFYLASEFSVRRRAF